MQYLALIGKGYRLKEKIAVSCKGTVGTRTWREVIGHLCTYLQQGPDIKYCGSNKGSRKQREIMEAGSSQTKVSHKQDMEGTESEERTLCLTWLGARTQL